MSTLHIETRLTEQSRLKQVDFENLSFGEQFSDHQLEVIYSNGAWQAPAIIPYSPMALYPAVSSLHYGQAVFEGMKAFRYRSSQASIFRMDSHYERFVRSCERVCIPPVPEEIFTQGIEQLVAVDKAWVPKAQYKSLYLRPIVFASDQTLGLRASSTYRFHILCSPVGNYYAEGIKPIRLTTMPEYVRAVKGGVGNAKVPGNYAASLKPTTLAQQRGFTQVLWLDAVEHTYVEEVGSMNIFFVMNDTLVTPPLGGSILPGITRDSVLTLAREQGIPVEERPVSIDELMESGKRGIISEIFGSGTAAVISPVGRIHHEGTEISIPSEEMGPVARLFYDKITGIQHGDLEDSFGWCTVVH